MFFYICVILFYNTDFIYVEMVYTEDKRHLSVLVWVQVEGFPDLEVIFPLFLLSEIPILNCFQYL